MIRATGLAMCLAGGLAFSAIAEQRQIELASTAGGLDISGAFVDYNGEIVRVSNEAGIVSARLAAFECSGEACPDSQHFLPRLRIAGESAAIEALLPALAKGFARSRGYETQFDEEAAQHETLSLLKDGAPFSEIGFVAVSPGEEFAALETGAADIALISRPITAEVADGFARVGLPDPSQAPSNLLVALEALVPVTSVTQSHPPASLQEIINLMAGDESQAGAPRLHMSQTDASLRDAILMRFDVSGPAESITWHETPEALIEAVSRSQGEIGLVRAGFEGGAKALQIMGSCGHPFSADTTRIKTGEYPLSVAVQMIVPEFKPHPHVKEFLDWMRTAPAHGVVRRIGLTDPGAAPITLQDQGNRLVNAITATNSTQQLEALKALLSSLSGADRLTTTFYFPEEDGTLGSEALSYVYTTAQDIADGRYHNRTLKLIGFSDAKTDTDAEIADAHTRASATRQAIVKALGGAVPEGTTLEVEAYGSILPVACETTPPENALNRRVELWVAQ